MGRLAHLHNLAASPRAAAVELEDPEVASGDVDGHVVDRNLADATFERAGVGVPVQDEVGAVLGDRRREPIAAEVRVDARRLPLERVHDWRIVEEDDADVTVHNRLQPTRDGVRLGARLGVDPPQQGLPEVRQRRTGKAADETLRADDAELEPIHLAGRAVAVEEADPGVREHLPELVGLARVVVVVAEHGEDRDVEQPTCRSERFRLLRLSVRRQIAGEKDDVGLAFQLGEAALDALATRVGRVDIGGRSNPHHGASCCAFGQNGNDPSVPEPTFEELIQAMKDAVGVLQRAEIPFVLGGGLSAWARGGPRSEHDVDFLVRPEDVETALSAFETEGWETDRPPEGWLVKAWHQNGSLVDLIYNPASGPITDDLIERAPLAEVMAVRVHVSTLEDVMVSKLAALTEQEPDFGALLEWTRALREQIDWSEVRARSEASPFARAFFTLVEGLGIVEVADELGRNGRTV